MKKFLISTAVIILSLMQFVQWTVFAESEHFEEKFLESLGILTMDETYKSDAEISRIEFVKLILKMTKTDVDGISDVNMRPFFDITESDEFFKASNVAYNMGLIRGGSDGCFRPYATISLSEAATILLRAMCGEGVVEKLGGTEVLANKLDLYDDLKTGQKLGVTYENAAILIYNGLEADRVEKQINGTYTFNNEESLLQDLYEIEYTEGTVDGNYKKSMYGEPTDYNFISIDGELYKVNNESYNEAFFGQKVIVYYTENSDDDMTITYMEAEKGEVFEFDFSDLTALDSEGVSYILSGTSKEKKEPLSRTCITIHNNIRINLTKPFDVSANGNVICIDNDDDGYIDILDITTADVYLVKYVNTAYDRIMFEDTDTVLDLKDYKDVRIIDKSGKNLTLSEIVTQNVVEVSISKDNKYITITVVKDKVSFAVAGITEKNDQTIITSDDGTEYKTVKGISETLRGGATYTFAIDSKGRICAKLSEDDSTIKIGVVMSTNILSDSDEGFVKLMGTDEKVYKVIVPEKVTWLNFNKRVSHIEAINEISSYDIIRFLEKDGVMKAFEVPSDDENYEGLQKIAELSDAQSAYTRYYKKAELIGGMIPINNETVIIRRDESKSFSDESAYTFGKMSDLTNGAYYPLSIAYRIGKNDVHSDVILMKLKTQLAKDSPIMLIQNVYKKYDAKTEETKTVFKGLVNNAETELMLEEEDLAYYKTAQGTVIELGVGDCIRYLLNKQGRIATVKLIFDYSDMRMYGNSDGNDLSTAYGVENLHRTGVVDYVRGKYVKIIADGLATQENYLCSLKNTGVYQVSVQDGRIVCEAISEFDIDSLEKNPELQDKVFVRMQQSVTGVFIVYKQD